MRKNWVFLNGQFLLENQAYIPITDRGFLYGDGLFTTLRVQEGQIEFWDLHVERLRNQSQQMKIECPLLDVEWIKELIN
jgi:4-amino-4-deoxychorismate lyase